MPYDQLLEHISSDDRAEVARLYAAFTAANRANPDASIDAFANALHERGLLSESALRDFLTYHALTLGTVEQTTPYGATASRVRPMALVAHGAMGEVYLGRDPNLKRIVAMKRIHGSLRNDEESLQRFLTEAQVTAQLDHPAIVPIYGLEKDEDGALAYAMKYVRGVTLKAYLEEAQRQISEQGRAAATHSLRARLETFIPVLNAIAYAHRRGVMHRDLKPENIMVGSFGEVLVMDWGIARVFRQPDARPREDSASAPPAAGSNGGQLTLFGAVMGTPAYMSPEQAAGAELDPASDQYSLGLVLQEVVTLAPAMSGGTTEQLVESALRGQREPLTGAKEPVPRELRAIITKATAKDKAARYESVDAMAADVRRFLRDESVEADPDRGLRRLVRWVGRNRVPAMSLGAGLLCLMGAVALAIAWQGQAALEAERAAAREREQQLTALGALVDAQARRMSAKLSRYEARVSALAASAKLVLAEPAPPSGAVAYQYSGGERRPEARPAYAVPSSVYGQPVSLRHADYTVAHGVDPVAVRPLIDQLARLEPLLRETLLASAGHATTELPLARAEELVVGTGVPVTWTYFGSAQGVLIAMPGTWDYADSAGAEGYDLRREAWYTTAIGARDPVWTASADESGAGMLLNCGQVVRADDGELLGIASLDLWPKPFIDEMMETPALTRQGVESMILDARLRVLMRTSDKDIARHVEELALAPYSDAEVSAAIRAQSTGQLSTGGRLALWNAIGNAGLIYLVVGPELTLLEAASALSRRSAAR